MAFKIIQKANPPIKVNSVVEIKDTGNNGIVIKIIEATKTDPELYKVYVPALYNVIGYYSGEIKYATAKIEFEN